MIALPDGLGSSYLWLLVLPIAAIFLGRVPVIGRLLSILSWLVIAGLLILVIGERRHFDPYIGRITTFLKLDDQQVSGSELRIRMGSDGHFWARAMIGGVERRMLVDSGATVTAISVGTARAAGLTVKDSLFPVLLTTANGTIKARTSSIGELRLGNIVARDLAVVVSPAFGDNDVLGMNFLSRLQSWRVEGRTLILVPNHPQLG